MRTVLSPESSVPGIPGMITMASVEGWVDGAAGGEIQWHHSIGRYEAPPDLCEPVWPSGAITFACSFVADPLAPVMLDDFFSEANAAPRRVADAAGMATGIGTVKAASERAEAEAACWGDGWVDASNADPIGDIRRVLGEWRSESIGGQGGTLLDEIRAEVERWHAPWPDSTVRQLASCIGKTELMPLGPPWRGPDTGRRTQDSRRFFFRARGV